MPLSLKKRAKMARTERVNKINAMSLNGHGYFMDAAHDASARLYIETGDESYLRYLPDYSKRRKISGRVS